MSEIYIVRHRYVDCADAANDDIFAFASERSARNVVAEILNERRGIRPFVRTEEHTDVFPYVNGEFVFAFRNEIDGDEEIILTKNKIS